MAWLKLTCLNGLSKAIINFDKVKSFSPELNKDNSTQIYLDSGGCIFVKESIDEIYAMLNSEVKHQMVEINNPDADVILAGNVAEKIKREYIGADRENEPFQSPDSSFNKRGI